MQFYLLTDVIESINIDMTRNRRGRLRDACIRNVNTISKFDKLSMLASTSNNFSLRLSENYKTVAVAIDLCCKVLFMCLRPEPLKVNIKLAFNYLMHVITLIP